jgi:ribonuclease VapC
MVVDTSAIIELMIGGPRFTEVRTALVAHETIKLISAASWFEAQLVVTRRAKPEAAAASRHQVNAVLRELGIIIEPVTVTQAQSAIDAYVQFGRGAGGGALNFGDCFSYALAKERGLPLLFVGDDFKRTDIASVLN